MSEIKENCRESRLYPAVIFLLLGIAAFAVLFVQKAMEPIVPNIKEIRTEVKTTGARDSVEIAGLAQRLDSMQNELQNIRDQYQMDINIGIDRLNSWIGFWLEMAGIVLLLGGVWQYMQVKRHDEAWARLEEKFDAMNSVFEDKMKNYSSIEKQFKNEKNDLEKIKDRLKLENTIFNLLRTMSAFHDPMMLCKEDNRKSLMLLYIEKTKDLLNRYYKLGENAAKPYSADEQMIMVLVYSNVRINICRSLDVFTSPNANYATKKFLDFVEEKESNFRYGVSMYAKDVEEFLENLEKLIVVLKRS